MLAAKRIFVGPAEVNLRRLADARQLQRDRGNHVGDRRAALDADDEPPVLLLDFHQRALLKLAGVAQLGLDEHDRHVVGQAMAAADAGFLFVQAAAARPMRHQHGKLQVLQAVPQKPRAEIGELERLEPQLGAALQPRPERGHARWRR